MSFLLTPPNEQDRLNALRSYQILDTATEQDFDDLTELASVICGTTIALISFIDKNRQWFKSIKGLSVSETGRAESFCTHAIMNPNELMEIEDAHLDERFRDNPLVTGDPHITFYAGVPLVNEEGYALGSLCVVDTEKKKLSAQQQQALKIIARQVMDKLELRKKVQQLEQAEQANQELYTKLHYSNTRNQTLIEQAPVAIIVFRGPDLLIETANPPMLSLLGKQADIINKPLLDAIPELNGQQPYQQLFEVYQTGKTIYGYDTPVLLNRDGITETGYYNFTYAPLIEGGMITGVIDMAVEVTKQVKARIQLEQAELTLRLAVEAANIGTWAVHATTRDMVASPRLKEMYGFYPDEKINLADTVAQVTDDYREHVAAAIEAVITHGGNYDVTYTVQGYHDHIIRWVRAIGSLNAEESGAFTAFTGIVMDITKEKQDEQRKNDFIAMVSHELKTPLTSMKAYVQMLLEKAKKAADPFSISALGKADNQVKKMTTMINGFLNVSRLESGKIQIDKRSFNMATLVKEVEEESIATISSHNIVFAPVIETCVVADRDKIGQVINNFISNAVKYSSAGTTIQVACVTVDNTAQVCVSDEGPGIKPEDQQKLFDRYYRVEGPHVQTVAGFGIGLYLCAEIIQRHEGRIWVESEVGKGSAFYFNLPIDPQLKAMAKLQAC